MSKPIIAISLGILLGCCVPRHAAAQQSSNQPPIRSPLLVALEKQLKSGDVAALDNFWREVKQQSTPLVEPIPGDDQRVLVTFLWRGEARRILEDLMREVEQRHVDAYSVALVHVALGQTEQAINWLERASEDRCPWFSFMANGDPRVDGLRSDRRFEKLVQHMITA